MPTNTSRIDKVINWFLIIIAIVFLGVVIVGEYYTTKIAWEIHQIGRK